MTLEEFEKSLTEGKGSQKDKSSGDKLEKPREQRRHHHHHHRSRHDGEEDGHRHKRTRHATDDDHHSSHHRRHRPRDDRDGAHGKDLPVHEDSEWVEKDPSSTHPAVDAAKKEQRAEDLQRDAWMQAPSALDIDYIQRKKNNNKSTVPPSSSHPVPNLPIHARELNKPDPPSPLPPPHSDPVSYLFGDAGSQWRMTKLKHTYRQAGETQQSVDAVALERYGDLRSFDDAREEALELERRETYGAGYVGKEKPSGDLFAEREIATDIPPTDDVEISISTSPSDTEPDPPPNPDPAPPATTLDPTALNKLKAQALKAKIRGTPDAAALEAEYEAALATASSLPPTTSSTVVLNVMEARLLAGGRSGQVRALGTTKRGRERGLVTANEDMSVEDMVREERRTRGQAGGEAGRFAERIAKDAKFSNDHDYLSENARTLAQHIHRSDINLKTSAVASLQHLDRILDRCPLCHHHDDSRTNNNNNTVLAPVVALATRVYLTLPPEPEICPGGACIVPVQHRANLLECDDDEWEEIRNFMKSLTRTYHAHDRAVLFYENAATPRHRHPHARMHAVPLPPSLAALAPAYFREAILAADEEWSQHVPVIDTLAKAKGNAKGSSRNTIPLGKAAFRHSLVSAMPYFHVWFELDGGMGHVVEDAGRWPRGDLFAREVLGGMVGVGGEVVRREGRWGGGRRGRGGGEGGGDGKRDGGRDVRGDGGRVEGWKREWGWEQWDWTAVLVEGG